MACRAAGPGVRAQSPGRVAALAQQAEIKAALDSARTGETQTIADQIRFCEVPAPPFNESARAQVLRDAFMRARPGERARRRRPATSSANGAAHPQRGRT